MNRHPLTYLISGGSTKSTNPAPLLQLAQAAIDAGISYLQIREKHLSASDLFRLTARVSELARGTDTKLLLNDRVDLAVAAGADGVHLPANGLPASEVRRGFGTKLLIGVSTHSVAEISRAPEAGVDLIVFGPVFATPDKLRYGAPVGVELLREVVVAAGPIPVLALGGVARDNFSECLEAGAAGIAGIRIFGDPDAVRENVAAIRNFHQESDEAR